MYPTTYTNCGGQKNFLLASLLPHQHLCMTPLPYPSDLCETYGTRVVTPHYWQNAELYNVLYNVCVRLYPSCLQLTIILLGKIFYTECCVRMFTRGMYRHCIFLHLYAFRCLSCLNKEITYLHLKIPC